MKLIIAGSRHIEVEEAKQAIKEAVRSSGWQDEITEIVHGGCRGVDIAADFLCRPHYPIKTFPANWVDHGHSAGPIRNRLMAEYGDRLIAIPREGFENRGTHNMIACMNELGKPVFVYSWPSRPEVVYDGKTQVMPKVNGESVRCDCACNVFTKQWTQGNRICYTCNSCSATWWGEV